MRNALKTELISVSVEAGINCGRREVLRCRMYAVCHAPDHKDCPRGGSPVQARQRPSPYSRGARGGYQLGHAVVTTRVRYVGGDTISARGVCQACTCNGDEVLETLRTSVQPKGNV